MSRHRRRSVSAVNRTLVVSTAEQRFRGAPLRCDAFIARQWPTGTGFEYFYGFVDGDANQWEPNLFRNTTQIYPFQGKPGWNLVTGMADEAIDWMTRTHQTDPSKPIFIKYAPGATHAPHHPTKEWVDKISKMKLFDQGWNKVREQMFENQKRLGVIPKDAKLSPWPKDVLKEWDQLTAEEKKLYIRQVEVFAAYVAYSDHEIGRVIQALEDHHRRVMPRPDTSSCVRDTLICTMSAERAHAK